MFVVLFVLIKAVIGVNILHIEPIGTPSHHIWNKALALGLVEKGHNVTMLSHDQEKPKKDFHVILLEGYYEKTYEPFNLESLSDTNALLGIKLLYDFSLYSCEHDLATNGLKMLMNYPKDFKFDLIIIDVTLQYCFYPLIEKFNNPPVVGVTPFLLPPVLSHFFGNSLQTAYFPYYSTKYTDKMNFQERVINFILIYAEILYRQYIALPAETKLAKKYFGENIKHFVEVERNITLLISNYDPILCFPLSLPPNIIPAGGLHVRPVKPLPKDLNEIVENAKEGVIIFTLGSFLRSDRLSATKRNAILQAFAKLPQTILWKFESEIENLPKNVIVRKWLPQNDILGHPNTKLFISHGGGLGTQEAMHHGIPVIAIPFFSDQHANAGKLVNRNMAIILNYHNLTTDALYYAITEIINNPMYSKNIKELSKRYNDQLNSPLDRAVFWVEYVLRHKNVTFLDLAARDMPGYQAASYDVIIALILGLYLIYCFICFVITCLKFIYKIVVK